MKKLFLVYTVLFIANIAFAQDIITSKDSSETLINTNKTVRYAGIFESGFGFTKQGTIGLTHAATLTQGVKLNNRHFIGIGIGFESELFIFGGRVVTGFIPIYANYRYIFKNSKATKATPFMSVSAGYRALVAKTHDVFQGGLWSNASVGLQFRKLVISLGTYAKTYEYQRVKSKSGFGIHTDVGVMFNIGFRF